MLELQIAVCILCGINLIGLFVVLIKISKRDNKADLTNDFKELGNNISLKIVNEQGSLKEHMA